MMPNPLRGICLSPATRQGRMLVKNGGILTVIACILHIAIGADPVVVCSAGLTLLLSIYPVAICGYLNIGAVLIAMVGLRYVGFALFAKLAMGQPLDTHLLDPAGSFGVVLLGLLGYLTALFMAANFSVGRPFLQPVTNKSALARILFLAAAIGTTANLAVAFRAGEYYTGLTIAEFFVPFLHLALICAVARDLQASEGRRSSGMWVIIMLILEIAFAMVQNSRMALMETFICWIVTIVAFEAKIKWRHLIVTAFTIGIMVVFITPVFLYVRSFQSQLSWTQRTNATLETMINWPDAFNYYINWRDISDRLGWYQSYYGSHQNVFERMSHVNNVDILKSGTDSHGRLWFEDLHLSIERTMPRIFAPNKSVGYGQGSWLYTEIGISDPGPYPTAPLIGTGYAAFGWVGAFCYPFILGLAWIVIIKKICGWNLQLNVWAIFLLLRVHNQFVEGSSDAYVGYILRILPQDLVLLVIVEAVARGRFLQSWRRKVVQVYGKQLPH